MGMDGCARAHATVCMSHGSMDPSVSGGGSDDRPAGLGIGRYDYTENALIFFFLSFLLDYRGNGATINKNRVNEKNSRVITIIHV